MIFEEDLSWKTIFTIQLAQTECALDRYKAKLFKKNLALIGMAGIAYLFAKVFVVECKKAVDAKKERDELAEKYDTAIDELNRMKKTEENKSVHCDGHATPTND